MTETLKLWGRYNQATNTRVAELMAALGPEAYTMERNTYFKTLAGLHLHLVQTSKFLLGLVRTASGERLLVSPLTEESYAVQPTTLGEAVAFQAAYDQLFVAFAESVTEADLRGPKFRRTMRSGKTYLLSLNDILTQYMNHCTHHRGQLSQVLDELGVEHDIGSVWAFTEVAAV